MEFHLEECLMRDLINKEISIESKATSGDLDFLNVVFVLKKILTFSLNILIGH